MQKSHPASELPVKGASECPFREWLLPLAAGLTTRARTTVGLGSASCHGFAPVCPGSRRAGGMPEREDVTQAGPGSAALATTLHGLP